MHEIIYKITLFLTFIFFVLLIVGAFPIFRGWGIYVGLSIFAPVLWIGWIVSSTTRQIIIAPFKIIFLWFFINIVMLLMIMSTLLYSINIAEAQGNDIFIMVIYFPINLLGFVIIYPVCGILDKFINHYFGVRDWLGALGIWLLMLIIISTPSLLIGGISYLIHKKAVRWVIRRMGGAQRYPSQH